jgi:hypothetical protein
MRGSSDGDGAVYMRMYNGKWPNETSVEFTGCLVIQYKAFVARLIVVLMSFAVGSSSFVNVSVVIESP